MDRRRTRDLGAILQNDLLPVLQAETAPPATLDVTTARTSHQIGAYLFSALLVVRVAGIVRHLQLDGPTSPGPSAATGVTTSNRTSHRMSRLLPPGPR